MAELLMIADDMTGALDSGVMLSARNIDTLVQIDCFADMDAVLTGCDAAVINTETRHLPQEEAFERVRRIVERAETLGVPYIYKKTDSALRGNIGAELDAVLQTAGAEELHFVPAFPQLRRVTVKGVQYVDGVPLDQSPFVFDPLNPAVSAYIPDIIAAQSRVPVLTAADGPAAAPCIRLYDAVSVEDMDRIARDLLAGGRARAFAGCAGVVGELAKHLPLNRAAVHHVDIAGPLMVFCGSMHEQGRRQIEAAERQGVSRYAIESRQIVSPGYWDSERGRRLIRRLREELAAGRPFLFNTIGEQDGELYPGESLLISQQLPRAIAELICAVLRDSRAGVPMIIGGDTLGAFLSRAGARQVRPVAELRPGVVLSEYARDGEPSAFIAKAGSFGDESLLVELIDTLHGVQI